ncbi:hypothetical protein ACFU44_14380 [Nocardia rhizosphaerihabitans]|uniref:hypothetical protein n=1 Tax=Nocardia rhizosphaerihabitans TaxID=1691570 RepID=UPI00367363D7
MKQESGPRTAGAYGAILIAHIAAAGSGIETVMVRPLVKRRRSAGPSVGVNRQPRFRLLRFAGGRLLNEADYQVL